LIFAQTHVHVILQDIPFFPSGHLYFLFTVFQVEALVYPYDDALTGG
jgi:hypothetical protein